MLACTKGGGGVIAGFYGIIRFTYGILTVNLLALKVYQILLMIGEEGGLIDYGYAITDVSGHIPAALWYTIEVCTHVQNRALLNVIVVSSIVIPCVHGLLNS